MGQAFYRLTPHNMRCHPNQNHRHQIITGTGSFEKLNTAQ